MVKDTYMVSFSGGKDSTAMLLRLLELGEPIDRIIFSDTGFEFPELYEYIERVEKYIGRKIEFIYPESTFEHWRRGAWSRGKNKGIPRGFPKVLFPCYWTREAKIKPLTKVQKNFTNVYVGIALDEKHRCVKKAGNIRYPLVEWGWSEQDCVDYLNKKGMLNPLYVNFNRLGCWMCPKQSMNSLYVLWKNYPNLWKQLLVYEKENIIEVGRNIFMKPLVDIEKKFIEGKIPKTKTKYECSEGCEGVKKAYLETQTGLKEVNCGTTYLTENVGENDLQ